MSAYLKAFTDLDPFTPEAGAFPTAEWLEMIVDDRRNAVVQHGFRMDILLDKAGANLVKIGDKFEHGDGENARKILEVWEAGQAEGRSEVNAYSQSTEDRQTNFTTDNKWGDGDGWNNSVAVGAGSGGGGGAGGNTGGNSNASGSTNGDPNAGDGSAGGDGSGIGPGAKAQ
jgi:hypothetical protein